MLRDAKARLVRDGVVIYEGRIASLRRFKDDVKEVAQGYECGIGIEGYQDIKQGDIIEDYEVREVARSL
jgi:translation initiation factor IF-2